ncbi:hypothetical protein Tco_0300981 [Tanacetum coccineum]
MDELKNEGYEAWDVVARREEYMLEGHEAPVYYACLHYKSTRTNLGSGYSKRDKNEAKLDKSEHEIGRVQEIKVEGPRWQSHGFLLATDTWREDQGLIFDDLKNHFDQGSRFEDGGASQRPRRKFNGGDYLDVVNGTQLQICPIRFARRGSLSPMKIAGAFVIPKLHDYELKVPISGSKRSLRLYPLGLSTVDILRKILFGETQTFLIVGDLTTGDASWESAPVSRCGIPLTAPLKV